MCVCVREGKRVCVSKREKDGESETERKKKRKREKGKRKISVKKENRKKYAHTVRIVCTYRLLCVGVYGPFLQSCNRFRMEKFFSHASFSVVLKKKLLIIFTLSILISQLVVLNL